MEHPPAAISPQTTNHPTARIPALLPGGSQIATTAIAAPTGCTRRASPANGPLPAITRPNSIPSGTITSGANRNVNSIAPIRAIPIRASTAIPAHTAAPAVAEICAQEFCPPSTPLPFPSSNSLSFRPKGGTRCCVRRQTVFVITPLSRHRVPHFSRAFCARSGDFDLHRTGITAATPNTLTRAISEPTYIRSNPQFSRRISRS